MTIPFLLLLLLPHFSFPLQCPCNITPDSCDTNCCCDPSCSSSQILAFSCPSFLLSSSRLCCKDSLLLSPSGSYQNIRRCSSDLGCLQDTPRGFGDFISNGGVVDRGWRSMLGEQSNDTVMAGNQYSDSDTLIAVEDAGGTDVVGDFMFPAQFYGDVCAMSPVKFYSEIASNCRRTVVISDLCSAGTILDYRIYLKSLLPYPAANSTIAVDLTANIEVYCLNYSTGVKELCTDTIGTVTPTPDQDADNCLNVVTNLQIYLPVQADSMILTTPPTVTITLTSIPLTLNSLSQSFSLSYKPRDSVSLISGNYGYRPNSYLLSGTLSGSEVSMNSDPAHRALALFKSRDCATFSARAVEFGKGYFTGCKVELPIFSVGEKEKYCEEMKRKSETVFQRPSNIVVGTTGKASTTDPSQWVTVETEPDLHVSAHVTQNTCLKVVSHVTYKVFYTEVGDEGNLQSVITAVKSQYTTQDVPLKCDGILCTYSLVLSNSVQFHYNTPDPQQRHKVRPRITAMLPLDFFYPLTSGGKGVVGGGFLGFVVVILWSYL